MSTIRVGNILTGWKYWLLGLEHDSEFCLTEWRLGWNDSLPVWRHGNSNTICYLYQYTRRKHINHEVDPPWHRSYWWQACFCFSSWRYQLCKRLLMVVGPFFYSSWTCCIQSCHTMCALVIKSMIGLYSPGNRIGPMHAVYGTDGGCECWPVGFLTALNLTCQRTLQSQLARAPGLETFVHIN